MPQIIRQLFAPTNKDLRGRILFTLGALMIFIIGTSIRVPGTQDIAGSLGFLELLNTMGGGALKQFSIFALGVMPYITVSIVMQLLQMDIIPYFSELAKQGQVGRQKLNQITRYLGIVLGFIEGYFFSFAFLGSHVSIFEHIYVAVVMTAGTAFLMWLSDQITQKGIGSGMNLIIAAGILATLPQMFIEAFSGLVLNSNISQTLAIILFILFVIVYFLIVIGVIFVQEAKYKIPVQYANKSTIGMGKGNYIPLKINTAGVVPVIFASAIITLPAVLANFIKNEAFSNFVNNYFTFTSPVGFIIYIFAILLFSIIFAFINMKPDEFAKNLQQEGGYIPGVRPGKDTEDYVSKILLRLTIVGSVFLAIIAGLPIIFTALINMVDGVTLSSNVTIGGTGLLIVVGTALETYKQIEGSVLARGYKKGYKRR